ncbi:MAG: pilus assembly protein TadG-related protein [Leptolinea sp.]
MHTLLCRFRRSNHTQPQPSHPRKNSSNSGQIIVIFAMALIALLAITGLAIDSGSMYVTYAQLRRAVDAAAVAAANDYKAEMCVGTGCIVYPPKARMTLAATEVMKLHGLSESSLNLQVEVCDQYSSGNREVALETRLEEFYNLCPDTTTAMARKLVWVEATQTAPLYFLSLFRNEWSIPLKAHSISEAAPIDLVIVIDTSESMASETPGYAAARNSPPVSPAFVYPYDYDTSDCNLSGAANYPCQPLGKAKDAAKSLINTLYPGYDRVAIVGFDVTAKDKLNIPMQSVLQDARNDVDNLLVRDDPPSGLLRQEWFNTTTGMLAFNPVNPEDFDGDVAGADADTTCDVSTVLTRYDKYGLWKVGGVGYPWILPPYGEGAPCDAPDRFDAYDWVDFSSHVYTDADDTAADLWLVNHGCSNATHPPTCQDTSTPPKTIPYWTYFTPNSTCTGCGVRVGAEVLKQTGRPNAVWIMVVLSDGGVNLSDTKTGFPNGYCNGSTMWGQGCVDYAKRMLTIGNDTNSDGIDDEYYYGFGDKRNCLKDTEHCPPQSNALNHTTDADPSNSAAYTVYDYALDMVDYAALNKSDVLGEISGTGSDIAIYAIGLGTDKSLTGIGTLPIGAYLLRYMAAVGDDGDRTTDECIDKDINGAPSPKSPTVSCGQYYYASAGSDLSAIFNDISKRIYSRLTQ